MGAFLRCLRCGDRIPANAPKITLEDGYRCTKCEYELEMKRGQMTLEENR